MRRATLILVLLAVWGGLASADAHAQMISTGHAGVGAPHPTPMHTTRFVPPNYFTVNPPAIPRNNLGGGQGVVATPFGYVLPGQAIRWSGAAFDGLTPAPFGYALPAGYATSSPLTLSSVGYGGGRAAPSWGYASPEPWGNLILNRR